ncbi:MAG: YihY/virulence factor BrkB family protein [Paludibacteraceae bacterium]|nr:YihY/virulence factor BrkB family protein [Paludibacteraceae bacterium]
MSTWNNIKSFLTVELWHITPTDIASGFKRTVYSALKTVILSIRGFVDKDLNIRASGLTYALMFAIVPILAMVLAVAKGFGFADVIEQNLNDSFLGQMNMVPMIMGFVERYLETAQGGAFIGVGLLILLWAVYSFFRTVEQSFNGIWNVRQSRSIPRQLTNYIFILFLIPILMVVTSGLSIFLNTAAAGLSHVAFLRDMQTWLVKLLPFVIAWAVFTWMYIAIPNTKVRFISAAIPGVVIGTLFQLLQMLSVYIIVFLSRTSVVYGAFASIPLLLTWLQWSCLMILVGAEMSFSIQNQDNFEYEKELNTMSRRYKDFVMLYLLAVIVRRFEQDEQPFTAHDLAQQEHIPARLVAQLVGRLTEVGLLREVHLEGREERSYQPALDTHRITIGMVLQRIDCQGAEAFLQHISADMQTFWERFVDIKQTHSTLDQVYLRDLL